MALPWMLATSKCLIKTLAKSLENTCIKCGRGLQPATYFACSFIFIYFYFHFFSLDYNVSNKNLSFCFFVSSKNRTSGTSFLQTGSCNLSNHSMFP